MMLDIDNEFDEIDSLLRDVETLKIAQDPNHPEHQEESRNNAPTDWQDYRRIRNEGKNELQIK